MASPLRPRRPGDQRSTPHPVRLPQFPGDQLRSLIAAPPLGESGRRCSPLALVIVVVPSLPILGHPLEREVWRLARKDRPRTSQTNHVCPGRACLLADIRSPARSGHTAMAGWMEHQSTGFLCSVILRAPQGRSMYVKRPSPRRYRGTYTSPCAVPRLLQAPRAPYEQSSAMLRTGSWSIPHPSPPLCLFPPCLRNNLLLSSNLRDPVRSLQLVALASSPALDRER